MAQRAGRMEGVGETLRWMRRRQWRMWRGWRAGRQLVPLVDRTEAIRPGAILLFATIRNEVERLPYFLQHYRTLGVDHFLIVDNDSTDGSRERLLGARDVSVWHTTASYRAARYGMDWLNGLLRRHGSGHWCVTVDADELLVYPEHPTRPLPALTQWLDAEGAEAMGCLMLDLFPHGPVTAAPHRPGQDPTEVLPFYDAANYNIRHRTDLDALLIRGGPRARALLADRPERAPTLTKVPLVRWHWRYAYWNSTHYLLPRRLNRVWADDGGERIAGVLVHTKFLNTIAAKSAEEKIRRQHFGEPGAFEGYHDALIAGPDLWHAHAARWGGWRKLEAEGLIGRGGWG
jgi:hypothetical protein